MGNIACIPDKGLRPLFKKEFKYRLPSRIYFTKCRSIVEEVLQIYCKRWYKKEGVGVHALNDWKNEFVRIVDIRIENFTTHPHLYKQPHGRSVNALKRKMEKWHIKYVFFPCRQSSKLRHNYLKKDATWKFWGRNWILRVHMYLLSWRTTNFFCVISIFSLNQISKLINLTCLHFIVDIRIENFTTHPHLFKQPHGRSVKALKRKMEKWYIIYVFFPCRQSSKLRHHYLKKRYNLEFWGRNWILRVHMYLLSWRMTNLFCVISIFSLNQISNIKRDF